MASELELHVDGMIYGGWTRIALETGIEQVAGSFEITLTERWAGQDMLRRIARGQACRVTIDGETVITGFVEDLAPSYDGSSHSVTVGGRDVTGDLVDSSAIHAGGQWDGRTLEQIARDLCRPFGIKVIENSGATERFPVFNIQEGETVFETIERGARMRGVLLVSDGMGNLLITRAGKMRVDTALVLGQNIKSGQGQFSDRERFSKYIVKGQRQGDDQDFGAAVAENVAEATDPGITRYRPLIVLGEDQGGTNAFRDRANWERNVRAGRSEQVNYTVTGWQHAGGLWRANQLLRVEDEFMNLQRELLISTVRFTLSDQDGELTELTLTDPRAFDVEPYTEDAA